MRIVSEYTWKSGPKGVTEEFSVKFKHSRSSRWEDLTPENHFGTQIGLRGINRLTPEERRRFYISAAQDFKNILSPPDLSTTRACSACARDIQDDPKILPPSVSDSSQENLADDLTRALLGETPSIEPHQSKGE